MTCTRYWNSVCSPAMSNRRFTRLPLLEPLPKADYYTFLSRKENRPKCEVYAWTLRQQLPAIPIPLRAPDADILVDLQRVFTMAYERGRYRKSLRYGRRPPAPLADKDKKWAMKQKTSIGAFAVHGPMGMTPRSRTAAVKSWFIGRPTKRCFQKVTVCHDALRPPPSQKAQRTRRSINVSLWGC